MKPKVTIVEDPSRAFINSLSRGMAVLEVLSQAPRPLNLTELAEAVGLNKVTVSRFCYTLVRLGYVHRSKRKRYSLTPKVLGLGYAALSQMDLRQVGESNLRELSRELGETVNMAILDGGQILYVARYVTEPIMQHPLSIGARLPVYCTSMGKAIAAYLPEDELQEVLAEQSFASLTHRTIVSVSRFREELARVRNDGFAVNDEELSVGLRSIAAPILRDGYPAGAINVAVPTTRYSLERLVGQLSGPLLRTARAISELLEKQVSVARV
ncbi:MAG: helix-turn-helix domain-containing protein [Desulfacinum sp.]|jgi:IclR family pca regulon transcriptional regulator|nr:helix-turn-helix domain-containing protein [Desulfacinum sp.]